MFSETRRDLHTIVGEYSSLIRGVSNTPTQISDIFSGIALTTSARKSLFTPSIPVPLPGLLIIPDMISVLGLMGIGIAPEECLRTASLTRGLPVRNILVLGGSQTISPNDSGSSGRCFGKNSSVVWRRMKTRGSKQRKSSLQRSSRSTSDGPLPPNSIFPARKVSHR